MWFGKNLNQSLIDTKGVDIFIERYSSRDNLSETVKNSMQRAREYDS